MTGLNILLGAGFSKSIHNEFPTMFELTDYVRNHMDFKESLRAIDFPHNLFASDENVNIENWIQTLENSEIYLPDGQHIDRRKNLVKIAENLILDYIRVASASLNLNNTQLLSIEKLLTSNSNILTTNYDLVLEYSMQELLIENDNDSPYALNAGLFDLAFQRRTQTYLSGGSASDSNKFNSRVFKLHGSCDWYSHDFFGDDKFWIDVSLLKNYRFPQFSEESRSNVRDMKAINALPTLSKNQTIGSLALRRIWKDAYKALKKKSGLAIYGSSINVSDGILNSLLAEALPADTPIFIWDPNADEVKKRIKFISPRSNITCFKDSDLASFCTFVKSMTSS